IKSLGVGNGGHFSQVVVASLVLREENNLIAVVLPGFVGVIFADEELTTYYRLDDGLGGCIARLRGCLVLSLSSLVVVEDGADELESTHHVAVVSNRYGRHLVAGRRFDQAAHGDRRLQYGKLRMVMQVYKVHRSHISLVGLKILRGNGRLLFAL